MCVTYRLPIYQNALRHFCGIRFFPLPELCVFFADGFFHIGCDELADVTAVVRRFLYDGGGKITPFDAGGKEHGLDAGHQCVVGLRKLDLVFKVRY